MARLARGTEDGLAPVYLPSSAAARAIPSRSTLGRAGWCALRPERNILVTLKHYKNLLRHRLPNIDDTICRSPLHNLVNSGRPLDLDLVDNLGSSKTKMKRNGT